jgi:uncharacterized protein YydD (DUF2326 family)
MFRLALFNQCCHFKSRWGGRIMFLKSLTISSGSKVIREINFRKGINLIVDETPISDIKTGNNIGKTTVLKLIDFCLGESAKDIFIDPDNPKNEYKLVKDFLIKGKVLVTLILKENLDNPDSLEIDIERNFLSGKETIKQINGQSFTIDEFELRLSELLFPNHLSSKPSFRQIISKNIRYKDENLNSTLRTFKVFKDADAQFEPFHLFLLGCPVGNATEKQVLLTKINDEKNFKKRLEKYQTKTAYETSLALINIDIENLNKKKSLLNLNENFEKDLDNLNDLKYKISKTSSDVSRLTLRRDIIQEAKKELEENLSNIDTQQLQIIYQQATSQVLGIQKTFEDLVSYHNQMIVEKVKFITQELPNLENIIVSKNATLKDLLVEEKRITNLIAKNDTFEDLEKIINELNNKFKKKGEYDNVIQQLNEVDDDLIELNKNLEEIDKELFSKDFETELKNRRDKFNNYFASISNELYGEQYALNYDIINNSKDQKLYKFSTFNVHSPNLSSGKKQGEISCFDIAYILFADEENIPCLHFILNDKKELMHGNQLVKIANLVNENNIQFVASILKDKLPPELNNEDYFVVKLSQEDKLFRIENQ